MKRRDIVPISGKNIDYLILGGKNIVEDKTIKILRILVIIMLNVFLIGLVANLSGTGSIMTLSKYGSRGNEVRQIQTRLKELGYNPGTIDGIYGTNTQNAVKAFQRDKGLSVDGIAGPKTLKALGISSGSSSNAGYTQNDINLLARIISAESRGESYTGQVAIGAVVLNRVEHPSFPDTIAGVIYQHLLQLQMVSLMNPLQNPPFERQKKRSMATIPLGEPSIIITRTKRLMNGFALVRSSSALETIYSADEFLFGDLCE